MGGKVFYKKESGTDIRKLCYTRLVKSGSLNRELSNKIYGRFDIFLFTQLRISVVTESRVKVAMSVMLWTTDMVRAVERIEINRLN